MLGRHVYRVAPAPGGGEWSVSKEGEAQSRATRPSRDEAVAMACQLAESDKPSRVTVENDDGTLSEERAFGVDPGQSVAGSGI
jgi:Uncharacterized protein conserved in bacteria (DUF2188)